MSDTIDRAAKVLPRWLVSAPNGRRTVFAMGVPTRWRPFGLQHAREVGSPVTACGLRAVEWEMFWDMPFPAEPRVTCFDCRTEVIHAEAAARRSQR